MVTVWILAVIGVEFILNSNRPGIAEQNALKQAGLTEATADFNTRQDRLIDEMESMRFLLLDQLNEGGISDDGLADILEKSSLTAGGLYHNGQLLAWKGQVPNTALVPFPKALLIGLDSTRGKAYFEAKIHLGDFSLIGDSIAQNIDFAGYLPISQSVLSADEHASSRVLKVFNKRRPQEFSYPISYLLDGTEPDRNTDFEALTLLSGGIAGYVAAIGDGRALAEKRWQKQVEITRLTYTAILLIILIVLYVFEMRSWYGLEKNLGQPGGIALLWIALHQSEILPELADLLVLRPFFPDADSLEVRRLIELLADSTLFALLGLFTIELTLRIKRLFGIIWYPRTIFFTMTYGLVFSLLYYYLPASFHRFLAEGNTPILDLNIYPTMKTLLFYAALGGSISTLMAVTFASGRFLVRTEQDQISWVAPLVIVGFMLGSAFQWYFWPEAYLGNQFVQYWFTGLFILLFLAARYFHDRRLPFLYTSRVRLIAGGLLVTAIISDPLIHYANKHRLVERVHSETEAYISKSSDQVIDGLSPDFDLFSQLLREQANAVGPDAVSVVRVDTTSGEVVASSFSIAVDPLITSIPETTWQSLVEEQPLSRFVKGTGTSFYQQVLKTPSGELFLFSAPMPDLRNHLFSFFRFYFSLLITGLVLYVTARLLTSGELNIFQAKERLQNRILDSYMMATLMFLISMAIATQLVVSNQQRSGLEAELGEKMRFLSIILNDSEDDAARSGRLDSLSQAFEIEVLVYEDKLLKSASTPSPLVGLGIPRLIGYDVYAEVGRHSGNPFFERREINGFPFLMGYQTLPRTRESEPRILAAVSTTATAATNEQLLETTSYLVAIYVIIFGLFIFGATFISKYLTKPVQDLLSGLNRISYGQFDTTVPVSTQDEIGELANAFNVMVYKLKDLQNELAEAERQAAWSEMARQVAHEIKNPLTPMKLSIQHLQRQIVIGDRSMEDLKPMVKNISDKLIEQIDSLSGIASDFSRFAKPLSGNLEIADVNTLLLSVAELYQHDKRINMIPDLDEKPIRIQCAVDELKRVFINLVKNSSEAVSDGGITMLRTYSYKDKAFVEVVDNGQGIPENVKPRIFLPNFSTKTSGTGLGLAICKKLIEAHDGEISFASVPGFGTTFTLVFPLYKPEVPTISV